MSEAPLTKLGPLVVRGPAKIPPSRVVVMNLSG